MSTPFSLFPLVLLGMLSLVGALRSLCNKVFFHRKASFCIPDQVGGNAVSTGDFGGSALGTVQSVAH